MKVHKAEQTWKEVREKLGGKLPPLTAQEATAAARKFWRHETGKVLPWPVVVTSGNRANWRRRREVRPGVMGWVLLVNPDRGWWDLIHDLSHLLHWQLNGHLRPHHRKQEVIEARMVRYALKQGWLTGGLKKAPKPKIEKAKPTLQEKRAARARAALARAEHRLKLAQAAIKRLKPKVRYYDKALAA